MNTEISNIKQRLIPNSEEWRQYWEQKARDYREKNKIKKAESDRLRYIEKKDQLKAQHKEYYQNNKDKCLEYIRKYHNEHKEEMKAYKQKYREEGRDKVEKVCECGAVIRGSRLLTHRRTDIHKNRMEKLQSGEYIIGTGRKLIKKE